MDAMEILFALDAEIINIIYLERVLYVRKIIQTEGACDAFGYFGTHTLPP